MSRASRVHIYLVLVQVRAGVRMQEAETHVLVGRTFGVNNSTITMLDDESSGLRPQISNHRAGPQVNFELDWLFDFFSMLLVIQLCAKIICRLAKILVHVTKKEIGSRKPRTLMLGDDYQNVIQTLYYTLRWSRNPRRSCWQGITQGMRSLILESNFDSDMKDVSKALRVSLVSLEMDSWITWCCQQFIVTPHQMSSYDRAVDSYSWPCFTVAAVMFFDEIHPCLTQNIS